MQPFNLWIYEKWLEHCEEMMSWTNSMPSYLSQKYFENYKWWLKREYQRLVKEEKENGNGKN